MKLIASGVANCAATTRSPSFSRSGSSTTTTRRPSRISSIASSMVANDVVTAMRGRLARGAQQKSLDVLREHIDLEVDEPSAREIAERGRRERVRDEGDRKAVLVELGDREAHTVDGDR